MDPELQRRIAEARAEGYTDEEINAYLGTPVAPVAVPQTVQQTPGTSELPVYPGMNPALNRTEEQDTTMALGAYDTAKNAALYGAGGYGAYRLGKAFIDSRAQAPGAPAANIPKIDVTGLNPSQARTAQLMATPAEQLAGQQAGQQSNWMSRALQQGYQAAKTFAGETVQAARPVVAQYGPTAAKYGGAAALALMPSSTGPKVPMSGPLRGSEINPLTGRGWTDEELRVYKLRY